MAVLPRDVADLYLAPVVLALDARIEELSQLGPDQLAFQIALNGDHPEWTAGLREAGLLQELEHTVEMHDWELSLDRRGIRMTHEHHTLVLGIPDTLTAYLSGSWTEGITEA
jgi:hypothetical protein